MSLAGLVVLSTLFFPAPAPPETVCGVVQDQSAGVIANARAELNGIATRLQSDADANGKFCFGEVEPGLYDLVVQARGFAAERRKVSVRAGQTFELSITLALESLGQQVTVAEGSADVASLNVAQTEIGEGLIRNLPREGMNAALSSILTLATPGVASDSNGVFHPLGEHAETSFNIDGQAISDQQSRIFSNQVSVSAIQEMRTLQGAPPAEFGDKTSLIVEATTRSGLNAGRSTGTISMGYESFRSPSASVSWASGSAKLGNFVAIDGIESTRFLDAPEFEPLHARGNAENLFDRFDWKPNNATSFHLNATAARSWFQVPNTYDQQVSGQDQRQHMTSFNVGLVASHIFNPALLVTGNTWIRQDRVNYYPSINLLSDQPATLSQSRRLTSTGARSDLSYSRGQHTAKIGVQIQVTPLAEAFATGLTDPAFNSPCVEASGTPVPDPKLMLPGPCGATGYAENPSFQPALLPYDLTRRGRLFQFRGAATIYEESGYAQDSIRFGPLNLNLGVRVDNYDGLSSGSAVQPRTGVAYRISAIGTVLHASYARVFLTPYNENLVLSSTTGPGGLGNGALGASQVEPLRPARRNQFNAGVEQQFGRKLSVEAQYFWKFTDGAYDFNTILNTPLNFPIQFHKSKIDGALVRLTLNNVYGFSGFSVLGHTRSRLFSPEIGGINFGAAYEPVARPDHDQGFEQTTNLQYQFSQRELKGLWLGFTWRFDSGLVVVSIPDYATALTLTGDQQHAIGLFCGSEVASVTQPLRSCASPRYGAALIRIAPGRYNADTNPSRIAPRSLFDIVLGADRVWKKDRYTVGAKIAMVNLANKVALYNFLSSFSGTHFISPRSVQGEMAIHF